MPKRLASLWKAAFRGSLGASCLMLAAGCSLDARPAHDRGSPDGGDGAVADASTGAKKDSSRPLRPPDGGSRADATRATRDGRASSNDGGRTDHASTDAGSTDGARHREAGVHPSPDSGRSAVDAGDGSDDTAISRVVGWSIRKREKTSAGADALLEEMPTDLGSDTAKPSRVVVLAKGAVPGLSWTAPNGTYISDFCVHPSGASSILLLRPGGIVALVRLNPALEPLETAQVLDPDIAHDPHVSDAGALDLEANPLTLDAMRIASSGEDVWLTVFTSWNSVIAYHASFATGTWSAPRRTLIEPPVPLFPNLPIGGSFDTFGSETAWFRPLIDVDEDGNAFVAVWANPRRIREHTAVFHDGLTSLPIDPNGVPNHDSDVLLTKVAPDGARVWSRVVGGEHEDEPYALRARSGSVAVVGRSRRAPGFDNTFWDVLVAITSTDGVSLGARAIALDQSSIALAVDSPAEGGWVLGGSDGWTQNQDGLSILTFGSKLLLELPSLAADPVRIPLPAGPRHNEIRTVKVDGASLAFGGHEDGPLTHSGDGDLTQIRATGVLGTVRR